MTRAEISSAITAERARQHAKWGRPHDWGTGDCSSPAVAETVKMAVLTEEVGEVARALLERDGDGLRRELVQVAAICVAWLEAL